MDESDTEISANLRVQWERDPDEWVCEAPDYPGVMATGPTKRAATSRMLRLLADVIEGGG